jgi:hypothetical protein
LNNSTKQNTGKSESGSRLIDGKTFLVPTSDAIHASHRALSSPREWQTPENDFPFRDLGPFQFSIGNFTNTGKFNAEKDRGFSSDITRFCPDTAIVYKYAIGEWLDAFLENRLGPSQSITLPMNKVLEAKGLKRTHNRDFTAEQKRAVLERLLVAASVHLQGETRLPNGKTEKIHGTLLDVISTGDKENGIFTPYEITISPGLAVRRFFDKNRPFGHFFSAILKLKTNRPGVDQITAMVAVYLAHQFTIRRSHGTFDQPFVLGNLLEASEVEIPKNSNLYGRFMENIEGNKKDKGVFNRLIEIGIIKAWQYKDGDYEALPDRGKFAAWLKCRVIFTPPDFIREEAEKFQAKRDEHITKAQINARKKAARIKKSKENTK